MKPALYYSIQSDYGSDYQVVAITSEKSRQWYGRTVANNVATHGTMRNLNGRFETAEAAQLKIEAIDRIDKHYKPQIEAIEKRKTDIQAERRRAIINALGK